MNDKKKLVVVIAALAVLLVVSVAIYDAYKDRVDPATGTVIGDSQAMGEVSTAAANNQSPAPDFTMEDASGKSVKLSDFKGKPVVLNFWTSWCSYCKEEMPYFESAYKEYGDKVQFIMLNPVKSERSSNGGKDFIKTAGYTFPVFYETEGKAVSQYGLRGFPATMFIDAQGSLVSKNVGAITQNKLDENIQALLGS